MTDEEDELTGVNLDVHIVQRGLIGLRGIDLGEVLHQDNGLDARIASHLLARIHLRGKDRGKVWILQGGVKRGNLLLLGNIRGCGIDRTGRGHEGTRGRRGNGICRRRDVEKSGLRNLRIHIGIQG